jgi:hypothetical protein
MTYSVELNTIVFKEFVSTNNQLGVGLMLGEKFLFVEHNKVMFHAFSLQWPSSVI